jgi:hypothetical protein
VTAKRPLVVRRMVNSLMVYVDWISQL